MVCGLQWMRRRQRRFTRVILALFGLVWLQVAAMPCVAAHEIASSPDSHATHGSVAHHHEPEGSGSTDHGHCLYCPPPDGANSGPSNDGGQCAFPHEAQVDARTAALAVPPLTPAWSAAVRPEVACDVQTWLADQPKPPPRRSFSVDYCRFLE